MLCAVPARPGTAAAVGEAAASGGVTPGDPEVDGPETKHDETWGYGTDSIVFTSDLFIFQLQFISNIVLCSFQGGGSEVRHAVLHKVSPTSPGPACHRHLHFLCCFYVPGAIL